MAYIKYFNYMINVTHSRKYCLKGLKFWKDKDATSKNEINICILKIEITFRVNSSIF